MKVIDLIIKLQQMNPNIEVVFDATNDGADMFKLVSVDDAEEVTVEQLGEVVMLSCGVEHPEQNGN